LVSVHGLLFLSGNFAPSSSAKDKLKSNSYEPYFIISSDGDLVFHISLSGADFPGRKCQITEKESFDYLFQSQQRRQFGFAVR